MYYDYDKERREAVIAGERAKNSLKKALDALNSARGWGIYDIIGGGFISSLIKHSKMNQASDYIEAAKADLASFSKELADIEQFADVNLSTGDFWGFADWFFDGFFSDLMMQDRINEARGQIQRAIAKIDSILEKISI